MARHWVLAVLAGLAAGSAQAVDWSQPPVACAEEIVPRSPGRMCPDLSKVTNPRSDWPTDLSERERDYWRAHPKEMTVCRAREILARESERPGSQPPVSVQIAWMQARAVERTSVKIDALYEAVEAEGMPIQVLAGAIDQESLFAEMGIAEDGGNYSCGIGQLNLLEWCRWANTQSPETKRSLGWPQSNVNCGAGGPLRATLIAPFYEIAKTRLAGLPEYRLEKRHFAGITYREVADRFPRAEAKVQELRYQAAQSFLAHCSDARHGILAKAHELRAIYDRVVPAGLKARERYADDAGFRRECAKPSSSRQYPLHTGWLLAVAAYNTGDRVVDAVAHYQGFSRADVARAETWKDFDPAALIESLYWAGKYNSATKKIEFSSLSGGQRSWIWFKGCVVQRHVARVVQRASRPGETLVRSLEGEAGCPRDGEPPLERQQASGRKAGRLSRR